MGEEKTKEVGTEEEKQKREKVKLEKIMSGSLANLVEAGLITEQGVQIQGMGILINQQDNLTKIETHLYGISRDMQRIMKKLGVPTYEEEKGKKKW